MPRSGRFTHRVDRYAEAVLDGGILVGPLVRQACQRHFRDRERAAAGGWFQFSEEHANQILGFFEDVLRLPDVVDEDGAGARFRLDVGTQFWAFVLGSAFGWIDERGHRRFREWYIEAGKGTAKALAVDTPIPTVDGWKAMGDIRPGDVLFDETGTRTTVIGAYDVMHGHECYRVTFDDGSSIVADAEHLWVTEQRKHGTGDHGAAAMRGVPLCGRGAWRMGVRTTAEIASTLRYKNGQYLSANHSIRLAGPLSTRQAFLPIEPYALGVWLGDGDSDTARITVGAEDREAIVGALRATGTDCGPYQPTKLAYRVRIGGNGRKGPNPESMNARLRRAGLLCNKHIPKAYLRSSIDQRLALLQGLMDTDGTIDPRNGVCTFTSTKPALADGLFELVVSLGMKATRSARPARLNGLDVGTAHYVRFNAPDDLVPFRLERKARHHHRRHDRRRLSGDRRIVACDPVASVPVRCIAVDSPSRLFLAGRSMVPTHNTPVLAGVGLYGMTMDGERAAEIYAAAADQDQANIMFRDAVKIAKASPDLDGELEYDGGAHIWQIRHPESFSFFRTFSRESGQKSGTRPHMGLLDELHEHPNAETSTKIRAGAKRRPQPIFAEITNAGYDRTSICWQRHEHARRVLDQTVEDERLLAYVCGLDDQDDPLNDPTCWPKTNPYIGVSVSEDYLRRQVENAKNIPAELNNVLRLNFCVWTQQHTRAIPMDQWRACQPMPSQAELDAAMCFGCLDLGETDDFTAWGKLWTLEDGRVAVQMRYFLPSDALARFATRPYAQWQRAELLTVTDGPVTDYAVVRQVIREDYAACGMQTVFYDPKSARETAQILIGEGLDMVAVGQGFALDEAIKKLLALVAVGQLCHGDDPILAWMADNTVLLNGTKGERRLAKERAPEKIDGIAALVMGLDGAVVRREREPEPEYQVMFVGGRPHE